MIYIYIYIFMWKCCIFDNEVICKKILTKNKIKFCFMAL